MNDDSSKRKVIIEREDIAGLLEALKNLDYEVIGPTRRDGAVVYDKVEEVQDLPEGWTDRQNAGTYRLERRSDQALFGYVVGPHSWKRFLNPPKQTLFKATRKERSQVEYQLEPTQAPRYAFLGVRACELQAIFVQDRVFIRGHFADPNYCLRRENVLIVAVNCGEVGGTCFCASMESGPKVTSGFDLALTEVLQEGRHYFVVEIGTEAGEAVMKQVEARPASGAEVEVADKVVKQAASQMGRSLDRSGLKEMLYASYEHPRWEEVAHRCLSCANCTMVCPTCFCSTVEDVTDLGGGEAVRQRKWDSCFNMGFSYIVGGSVRSSVRARYRQWLTHKLGTWTDQFGVSGCVGCGRCITWCPVGIDLTEEIRALRATPVGAVAKGAARV